MFQHIHLLTSTTLPVFAFEPAWSGVSLSAGLFLLFYHFSLFKCWYLQLEPRVIPFVPTNHFNWCSQRYCFFQHFTSYMVRKPLSSDIVYCTEPIAVPKSIRCSLTLNRIKKTYQFCSYFKLCQCIIITDHNFNNCWRWHTINAINVKFKYLRKIAVKTANSEHWTKLSKRNESSTAHKTFVTSILEPS
jgi:hypothetical protein